MSTEPCLSFAAIHAALSRCMQEHPPQGLERSLHPDADALASKWALMSYLNETEIALRGLDETFLQAFSRWDNPEAHVDL